MKFEKSCGAVVFRNVDGQREFLLVQSKKFSNWGFPKGHVEENESEEETALREVVEETGLKIKLLQNFRISVEYEVKKGVIKEVVFFIGEPLDEIVEIKQDEIQDYKWLTYSDSLKLLSYENNKKVLNEVNNSLAIN